MHDNMSVCLCAHVHEHECVSFFVCICVSVCMCVHMCMRVSECTPTVLIAVSLVLGAAPAV